MNDDELTRTEKEALDALPRERVPRARLRQRTVEALRARGLLRDPGARVVALNGARLAAVAAACVVLLAGGFALGRWTSRPPGVPSGGDRSRRVSHPAGGETLATSLQQAGSMYVAALESLVQSRDSTPVEELAVGREVALNTLYAVAQEAARAVPDNTVTQRIVQAVLEADAFPPAGVDTTGQARVVWF